MPTPAPTIVCSVHAGQWTKSHGANERSSPSTTRTHCACEHEKVLLRVLAVVHGHRLAGREGEQVHTELRERQDSVPLGLVIRLELPRERQELASPLAMKPARLARVDDEPPVARGDEPASVCSSGASGTTVRA